MLKNKLDPGIAESVENVLNQRRFDQFVQTEAPEELVEAQAYNKKPDVPKWKEKRYQDRLKLVSNEGEIFKKIKSGLLSYTDAEDFKRVNPMGYERMAFSLWNEYKNGKLKKKLNYYQTLALERFLGRDLTGLQGGLFGLVEEGFNPVKAYERKKTQKEEYIRATLRKGDRTESLSTTQKLTNI